MCQGERRVVESVRGGHTGNALIQDVVGMEDIVEQFLACVVEYQDFPLFGLVRRRGGLATCSVVAGTYLALGGGADHI